MPSQGGGGGSKEQKKKNSTFLKEGRLSAQPRGKTQKNNKQQQEKRESRPKHVQ